MGERECVCVWEELTVQDVVEVVQGRDKKAEAATSLFSVITSLATFRRLIFSFFLKK
jgi:hypothetical protein